MFFEDWIKSEEEFTQGKCKIVKFSEITNARENIYEELTETVINHYSERRRVKKYLKDEKFSKLENYINERLPTAPNHEKGDFGEIFGTEHLKQIHNYTFPILKLKYKTKPNESLKGEDILGFYIEDDEITRICVGESKIRSNSDSKVIEDAFNQLEKAYKPHPVWIKFFSDQTYYFNEDLAEKIEDLISPENMLNQIKKDNWIFYITGFRPKKFKTRDTELDNLILVNMYFEDLNEFISTLFKDCRGHYHEK